MVLAYKFHVSFLSLPHRRYKEVPYCASCHPACDARFDDVFPAPLLQFLLPAPVRDDGFVIGRT
jgi:hypothetical protein